MATIEELNEKRMRTLAKWASWVADAEAQGQRPNMSKFVDASKGTDWETNQSSMHNWVRRTKKTSGTPNAQTTPTPAATTPDSPEGIKAEIARLQQAYKASLQGKVHRLKTDIAKMQEELAEAELELEEITA